MKKPNPLNRRQFIGQAGCAALGTTGLLSTILNLGMASRVHAFTTPAPSDYKAMICIFLLGGNDSWNMVVPTSAGEFAQYQTRRGNLALSAGDLRPLTMNSTNMPSSRSFGVHPKLQNIQGLYNAGKLSFVSNVGSLYKPITGPDDSTPDKWPVGLYSHSDQQQQWQTCVPNQRSALGWAGLAQDIFNSVPTASPYTYNISLSGSNILQTGKTIVPYTIGYNPNGRNIDPAGGGIVSMDLGSSDRFGDQTASVNGLMAQTFQNVFDTTYAGATRDARDAYAYYKSKLSPGDVSDDKFPTWTPNPDFPLEARLKQVANMIMAFGGGADPAVKRQTFFIGLGGFDTHSGLLAAQPALFEHIDTAVGNFWSKLEANTAHPEMKTKVTLFTASDFGRTLSTNGTGADHAWGGNHFVISGDPLLQGGRILGNSHPDFAQYPLFDAGLLGRLDASSDPSRREGRLIPGLSVEEYMYPILNWYGLTPSDIYSNVFPGYVQGGFFGTSIRSVARFGLFSGTQYS